MAGSRIGVMTWFRYENYGTALQAVALCEAIRTLGCEPELIDYRPRGDTSQPSVLSFSDMFVKLASKINGKKLLPYSSEPRSALFASFVEDRVETSERVASSPELKALAECYSAVVCGSDQVWSPNCFDANYFLPFVAEPQRRIAYAPSFGVERLSDPDVSAKVGGLLEGFGSISTRESSGARIVESLTGRPPVVVLDPTLLFDPDGWDDILGEGGECVRGVLPEKGYVLCYFLGDPSRYMAAAKRQSEALDLPLLVIPAFKNQGGGPGFEVGPAEFVGMFRSASYVCTDSFHGIAFAVNFGVPFTAYKRFRDGDPRGQNTRVTGFLDLVDLSDRLSSPEAAPLNASLDFSAAHRVIDGLREVSLGYLSSALEGSGGRGPDRSSSVSVVDPCCGCGACMASCPKGAIRVGLDGDGFQRCSVDEAACVGCGACVRVCPLLNPMVPTVREARGLFSYKSAGPGVLDVSSSGGFGHDAANLLASTGFKVFGCSYDRDTDSARHIEATDELSRLQGSKYIQSASADAMGRAFDAAVRGDRVAFFGTPCQVAGFDALLRRRRMRDRAVLVDLICHGVPSALLWRRYLAERREEGVGEHPDVTFRSKANGWSPLKMMMMMSPSKDYSAIESKDDFYAFFSRGLCYSKSCYECPFRERSAADVRMGDYWGPRFSGDRDGVSMVVAMSERGSEIVGRLASEGADATPQDLSEYWSVQFPYNRGVPLDWDALIGELRDGSARLSDLRREYCAGYEQRERIGRVKGALKSLIGGSR